MYFKVQLLIWIDYKVPAKQLPLRLTGMLPQIFLQVLQTSSVTSVSTDLTSLSQSCALMQLLKAKRRAQGV